MTTDHTRGESDQETIRRLSRASQELATALSDATRPASTSETATADVAVPWEETEPQAQVEDTRQSGVRRAARAVAWPVRRLLDARFQGLAQQLDQKQIDLFEKLDALSQEDLRHHQTQLAALTRVHAMLEQLPSVTPGRSPQPVGPSFERPRKPSRQATDHDSVAAPSPPVMFNPPELPLPPLAMRELVGEPDPSAFQNTDGAPVFPEVPPELHRRVFDFGCGCGRIARKLLQQRELPEQYVGIDLHRGMIDWCRANLAPHNEAFRFLHHNVYNLTFNPTGGQPSRAPFPIREERFTLVNAHSVFTHILEEDIFFYLQECARVLAPHGVLRSTWFLFDKALFPMMQEFQNSLYINTIDPTNAVIVDRAWLQAGLRDLGLAIVGATPPSIRGFQWILLMRHAGPDIDEMELPEDIAPEGLARPPLAPPNAFDIGRT